MSQVLALRLALLRLADLVPPYWLTSRLIPLSKNPGSSTIKSVAEVRPIGLMPFPTKYTEKAIYLYLNSKYPKVFDAGFT